MKKLLAALLIAQLALSAVAQQAAPKPEALTVKPVTVASAPTTTSGPAQVQAKANVEVAKTQPPATPPTASTTISNKHELAQSDAKKDSSGDEAKLTDVLQTIFNGGLAFITLGLLIMGIRQEGILKKSIAVAELSAAAAAKAAAIAEKAGNVAEKTVITMEDTAARQLRAYVLVEAITIEAKPIGAHGQYQTIAHIHIRNYGSIPAQNVVTAFELTTNQSGNLNTMKPIGENPILGVVPPKDKIVVKIVVQRFNILHIDKATLTAFQMSGELFYHDGFVDGRKTQFRWHMSGPGLNLEGPMTISAHGNFCT